MSRPRATVAPDGRTITLTRASWSETFAADQLPGRIALYETLRDRRGGAYAQHHEPTVRALRAAAKVLAHLSRKEHPA